MKKKQHARNRFSLRIGKQDINIMQHLTYGDLLMSVLLSARSTRQFYREANKRALARYRAKKALERLQRSGYVVATRHADPHIILTKKGGALLQRALLLSSKPALHSSWEGTWTLVLYDIPVSHSAYRYDLRSMLIRAGFRKLQHSVWISPHPCEELQRYIEQHAGLRRYVRILTANPAPGLRHVDDWEKLPLN